MIAVALSIVALTLLLGVLFSVRDKRSRRFPKGPVGLPFIGQYLEFGKHPLECLTKWQKQYGDIVGLRIGAYKVVVLSSVSILKEAFENHAFNVRANLTPYTAFSGGVDSGTLTASTQEMWDDIRRFTIKELNEIGFGKRGTEDSMMWEVSKLINYVRLHAHDSLILHDVVMPPIAQYVWCMITGRLVDMIPAQIMSAALLNVKKRFFLPIGSPYWFMPKITERYPLITGYTQSFESAELLHKALGINLEAQKKNYLERVKLGMIADEETPSNLMEAFLAKMVANKDNPESTFHGIVGENNLKGQVFNIFTTGVISLCNILNWAMIYIASYPEIQQKIYDEICNIMGSQCDRNVELSDMESMKYVGAFMKEVFRMSSTAPFSNFHEVGEDVEFHGYHIPKGTVVIGNLYGANHNAKVWGDPEVFRPERFLNTLAPSYLTFSVGLRTCPGQTFARNSFFLYVVSLVQNFEISFDTDYNAVPTQDEILKDCLISVFRFSKPYRFHVKERTYNPKQG